MVAGIFICLSKNREPADKIMIHEKSNISQLIPAGQMAITEIGEQAWIP